MPPIAVFWTLRFFMFLLSFVLEYWALQEQITSTRHRPIAVLLVASSYVTWTFQTHTFSNSVETLAVLWSLVLIGRITSPHVSLTAVCPPCFQHHADPLQQSSILSSVVLGMVVVFGTFNRITFPAFLLIPGLWLVPYYWKKCVLFPCISVTRRKATDFPRPLSLAALVLAALVTACTAIAVDTAFYTPGTVTWSDLITHPVITPLNNLVYNSSPENLALHGLHPWYQHLVANLPQLIGPAVALMFLRPYVSLRLWSAISGIAALSFVQHQEARFLLPAVPLILSSLKLPRSQTLRRLWIAIWVVFNLLLGVLMGTYHQGGIIPGQVFLSKQPDATTAVWWKTYSPPIWLLNGKNEVLTTKDVMGMKGEALLDLLTELATCDTPADRRNTEYLKEKNGTYLIAPASATWLDPYLPNKGLEGLRFREVWRYRKHVNLDDLDFGDDGVWNTLSRVIGRRGLVAWRVTKSCEL